MGALIREIICRALFVVLDYNHLVIILDVSLTIPIATAPDMVITIDIFSFFYSPLQVANSLKLRLAYCRFVKNIVLTTLDELIRQLAFLALFK
jgi:hypothetical protein